MPAKALKEAKKDMEEIALPRVVVLDENDMHELLEEGILCGLKEASLRFGLALHAIPPRKRLSKEEIRDFVAEAVSTHRSIDIVLEDGEKFPCLWWRKLVGEV